MTIALGTPLVRLAGAHQRRAADPAASAWVAASAGTGKTKVLTDRVLNLMLTGTEPSRILCLTFTKAAAAEMANRIAARLALWTAAPDVDLEKEIEALTGQWPDVERCRRARQLFARVLDAPGGMKIQTIHAFCQALLRRFPLEAGIAPHFEVLDDRSAAELLQSARESALSRARSGADQDLAAALAEVTAQCSEDAFAELMQSLLAERGRLAYLLSGHGGCDGLVAAIRELLGLEPDEYRDGLLKAACEDGAIDLLGLRLAVEALLQGSKTDRERGDGIAAWLAAPDRRAAEFETYRRRFLTDGSGAGLKIRERLITKAAEAASPGAKAILQAEAERLHALGDRLNAATLAAASGALLTLGGAILDAYRRQKEVRAQLDYDDLILATRDLLKRPGVAPWVLFKLDGGLDHILIDEAQDTNPDQWQVVQALAEEFFVGAGARPETRTIFAVGDPKQSIFSFQRADPAAFEAMRKHFSDRAAAARTQWEDVPLNISFRSTAAVLSAVDAVFDSAEAQAGVALDGQPIVHQPSRVGHAGLVELWPPAQPREMAELEPWAPPVDRQPGDSPRGRLARLIAAQIEMMIATGEKLRSRDRPVRPGDFMVLVGRRNAFVEELVRELKQRQVPVAGVDRMVLTDQIAVMDLMAFGQFLLLPEDDLTLATVLKGPLVGLDEEELFRLAYGREGSLWSALRQRAEGRAEKEDVFAQAHAFLAERLATADFVPPYELYADLLGRLGGRRALLGRLGPEAADPIDEFMNLALMYERGHAPSLQGFLHWLAAGDVEVKRDLEQDLRGQVRIMTIHGAKGLQAPIVFLPDTMQMPNHTARLLWCESKSNGGPGASQALPLWSPRTGCDEAVVRAARARHRQAEACEYRRLLYVALTRAEDRLYVCGWHGKQTPRSGCWYDLVGAGLATIAEEAVFDCTDLLGPDHGWSGRLLRLADPQLAVPDSSGETPPTATIDTPTPGWFGEPAPEEPLPWRPLAPSRPSEEEPPVQPPLGADDGLRFRRGRLIHRLLETLPEIPATSRAAACRRFLARPTHDLSEAQQQEITAEVLRVLEDPVFAPLFGPDSRAEVMVVGEIRGENGAVEILSGRIDRLVATEAAILIVDYKANRPPPEMAAGVPALYLRQMACYRAALTRIYPGRPVTCALLWTDGPRLMPLPAEQLDRYLP